MSDIKFAYFKGNSHEYVLVQVLIVFTIDIAMMFDKWRIQIDDSFKIVMIACNCPLKRDSEYIFIHYHHHLEPSFYEDVSDLFAFGQIHTEANNLIFWQFHPQSARPHKET